MKQHKIETMKIIMEAEKMVVKAYVRVEAMKESLVLRIENNEEQSTITIPKSKALEPSGAEFIRKLADFEGIVSKKGTIESISLCVRKDWMKLPRKNIKGFDKTEIIYSRLIEYAEKGTDTQRIRIEEDVCYIRATQFDDVLAELDLCCDRKEFFKSLKEDNLLDYNAGRNDKKMILSGMTEQDRFICILPECRAKEETSPVEEVEVTECICDDEQVTSETAKQITAFPYPGAKNMKIMNNAISTMLPMEINNLKEPYAGSAAISLNAKNVIGKISLNDKDKAIVNLWSVLADKEEADLLLRKLGNTEYSKNDFEEALKIHDKMYDYSRVDRAWSELVLVYCSFDCLRNDYRKMNADECNKMRKRIVNNIRRTVERLQKQEVEVTNTDALEIIANSTVEDTLYIDPPYDKNLISSENLYRFTYNDNDQISFLTLLQEKGNSANAPKMLVSGYGEEDISKDFYGKYLTGNWKRYKVGSFHKPTANKKGVSSRAIEYVWCNYELHETAFQFVSLADERKGGVCNE